MRITAFIIDGITLMPAFLTAITNGDALISVLYDLLKRAGSSELTIQPIMINEII